MRASCQPASGVHSTRNMWSVKWTPKPGLARISASRASSTGLELGVVLVCMVVTGSDPSGLVGVGNDERRARVQCPAPTSWWCRGSAAYSRDDGVADLGGTSCGRRRALGQVGDDCRLDDRGGV